MNKENEPEVTYPHIQRAEAVAQFRSKIHPFNQADEAERAHEYLVNQLGLERAEQLIKSMQKHYDNAPKRKRKR